jgi:hypothetical protein
MLNVKDFGAVGDGVTDDTAAIQATIDAGTGEVLFPAGGYIFSQIVMRTNVWLKGEGFATRLLQLAGFDGHMIVQADSSVIHCGIRDMAFNGQKSLQTTPNDLIHFTDGTVSGDEVHTLQNLLLTNAKGNGIYLGNQVREVRSSNLYILGCEGVGVYLDLNASDSSFTNVDVGQSGLENWYVNGFNRFTNCKGFMAGRIDPTCANWHVLKQSEFSCCEAQDGLSHGWLFDGCYSAMAFNCNSDSNAGDAFRFVNANYCRLEGHVFDSGRADHTAIVNVVSGTGNLVRASYVPGALLTGASPLQGALAGNNVQVGLPLVGSVTYDPSNLIKGAQTTITVSVPGAVMGDAVAVSFSLDLQGLQLTGGVSSPGVVTCVLQNGTGSNVNLGSGTLTAKVVQ